MTWKAPASGANRSRILTSCSFAVGVVDKAVNRSTQIQERVHLDRGFGGSKQRQREHRQTQIDGRRVHGIDEVREIDAEAVFGIERSSLRNEHLGEVGVCASIAGFVGIGQGRVLDRFAKAHVVELGGLHRQAGFDVAKAITRNCSAHASSFT